MPTLIRCVFMLFVVLFVNLLYAFGVITEAQGYTIVACVATIVRSFI